LRVAEDQSRATPDPSPIRALSLRGQVEHSKAHIVMSSMGLVIILWVSYVIRVKAGEAVD